MSYLSDFKSIENWYNRTPPVVSHLHPKEQDIRPISDRRRKHERIVKINSNCYALLGGYLDDGVAYTKYGVEYSKNNPSPGLTKAELKRVAPIVWERKPDGSEYVTIHNTYHGYATGWYEFMRRYLPYGLDWPRTRDGRQWLKARTLNDGNKTFFVPTNKYLTKTMETTRFYTAWVKDAKLTSKPSAERKLTFKRHEEQVERWGRVVRWELVSEAYENPTTTKYHIDKDAKRAFKPQIDEFREWARIMVPVLQNREWEDQDVARRVMCDYHTDWKMANVHGGWWRSSNYDQHVREILGDPESPGRVELAYDLKGYMEECDREVAYYRKDDNVTKDRFNERFNNFINIACGFRKPNNGEQ